MILHLPRHLLLLRQVSLNYELLLTQIISLSKIKTEELIMIVLKLLIVFIYFAWSEEQKTHCTPSTPSAITETGKSEL